VNIILTQTITTKLIYGRS